MGLFSRFKNKSLQQSEDMIITKACGIDPKRITVADHIVFGIVHFPIGIKKHNEYLSTNKYLMIDESLIAFKLAKYRFERYLFLHQCSDHTTMETVKSRVQKALSELNGVSIEAVVDQWRNRSKLLSLVYIRDEERQYPEFIENAVRILKRDYSCDAYKEISADAPEEIWDFMKDSMLRIEVQSFISNYDSTIKNAVESIDLS